MSKFWKKTLFWDSLMKTCAIFGGSTTAGLHAFAAADGLVFFAGAFSTLGALLSIWMIDGNKNGTPDLFE